MEAVSVSQILYALEKCDEKTHQPNNIEQTDEVWSPKQLSMLGGIPQDQEVMFKIG